MKRLVLTISLMVFILLGHSQNIKAGKDSMKGSAKSKAMRWQKNRILYQQMYLEDPYAAVDSVNEAEQRWNAAAGKMRLGAYENNTRIDTLREMDLSHAGLEEVPELVYGAMNLEVLILDYNRIKKLPKELGELPHLKRIYWRANALDKLFWIRISKMDHLEKLDISNNLLRRLPSGIKKLKGLKELVLNQNFFGEIPIARLSRAESVEDVAFNKSHQMRIQAGNYGKLKSIKVLKVNNSKLESVDPSLYNMPALNELQLQENELSVIPAGISKLHGLTKLSFYKNKIRELPKDLFEMNLKVIDLYYNELEVVPEAIAKLKKLEILYLAHNKIYSLPESIGELTNLDQFYIHHNRLSVLPHSISKLSGLKTARVNDNYLSEFPAQFLQMAGLKDLDVSNNQLTTLDPKLEQLPNLHLLSYHENPIDFEASTNQYISPMIIRMLERGVVCVPRIYKEKEEESQGE